MDVVSLGLAKAYTKKYAAPLLTAARFGLPRDHAFMGDSITYGGQGTGANLPDLPNNAFGDSWPMYAHLFSLGRIRIAVNAGVSGNTTDQMLARFQTDVLNVLAAKGIGRATITIFGGHNDGSTNYPNDTDLVRAQRTISNVTAMVNMAMAAGHIPVVFTMMPNNSTTERFRTQVANTGLRRLAESLGIPSFDMWATLVNIADGTYKTATPQIWTDSTHPNQYGYQAMGKAYSAFITPLLVAGNPALVGQNLDSTTLFNGSLPNPLMLTQTVAGTPDTFTWNNGTSGYTHSLTTDATLGLGNIAQIVGTTGASGNAGLNWTIPSTKLVVGNKVAFGIGLSFAGSNVYPSPTAQLIVRAAWTGRTSGSTDLINQRVQADIDKGVLWFEDVVPPGTTALTVQALLNGVGTVKFWQPTIRDLTALGVS